MSKRLKDIVRTIKAQGYFVSSVTETLDVEFEDHDITIGGLVHIQVSSFGPLRLAVSYTDDDGDVILYPEHNEVELVYADIDEALKKVSMI